MDTYVKAFRIVIEKTKVFIEASVTSVSANPEQDSIGLISIESPTLRSLCTDDSFEMRRFLESSGNYFLEAKVKRDFRASLRYSCKIWSRGTRQWTDAELQPKYIDQQSANGTETVLLIEAAEGEPTFKSVPLTDNLLFSLCNQTEKHRKSVIYIQEGSYSVLPQEAEYEAAINDALRTRSTAAKQARIDG